MELDNKAKERHSAISAYNILYSKSGPNHSPKRKRPASSYVRTEIRSKGLKRVESERPNHVWKNNNLHLNQIDQIDSSTFSQKY